MMHMIDKIFLLFLTGFIGTILVLMLEVRDAKKELVIFQNRCLSPIFEHYNESAKSIIERQKNDE